jgi:hypothetical protein
MSISNVFCIVRYTLKICSNIPLTGVYLYKKYLKVARKNYNKGIGNNILRKQ